MSDTGSERGVSPHMSDPRPHHPHPARFAQRPAPFQSLGMPNAPHRYTDPGVPLPQQYPLIPNPYPTPTASIDGAYGAAAAHQNGDYRGTPTDGSVGANDAAAQAKAFACSNCGKGFARRSDLARHGRLSMSPRLIVAAD